MPDAKHSPLAANTNRRDFLRQGTATGVGAALLGTAFGPRAAHAGVDDTLKVALIGCGGRGTGAVAQALATTGPVKLWAMADAFADRLDLSLQSLSKLPQLQGKLDVPPQRRFVGLGAYRQAIDSGVDVVLLTTSPGYRPLHFEYAVNAKKHVFMEKPVATDSVGVRRLLAANQQAQKFGLKIGVGLQRHHDPTYHEMLARVADGTIGDVQFYRCYWNVAAPAKQPPPREGLTELEYQVRNWYFFTWLSGDHIVEQHIHNIDVCNWVHGGYPVEAQGQGGRQVRTGRDYGDIFDHHFVEFTYADGRKMFSQCRQIPGCHNQVAEMVHGAKGVAEMHEGLIRFHDGREERFARPRSRQRMAAGQPNAFQLEHDALFAAIRNNTPHNELENGAYSTLTAIMGRMATHTGKLVTWQQALESEQQLTTDSEDFNSTPPTLPGDEGYYPVSKPGVTPLV